MPAFPLQFNIMKYFAFLFCVFLLVGCSGNAPDPTPFPALLPTNPPVSEADLPAFDLGEIALGETVYAQECASCHGANLEGQPDWKNKNEDGSFRSPPHDETGHTWHHPDSVLLDSIRLGGERLGGTMTGMSNMPAFSQTLTDDEITAVLTYIKSTWSDDIRLTQWEQTKNQP